MLAVVSGCMFLIATIWCTLCRVGFIMKKVSDILYQFIVLRVTDFIHYRLLELLQNTLLRSMLTMLLGSHGINQSSLFSLTRALLIAVQHIGAVPGQSGAPKHNVKPSLSTVDGEFFDRSFFGL